MAKSLGWISYWRFLAEDFSVLILRRRMRKDKVLH